MSITGMNSSGSCFELQIKNESYNYIIEYLGLWGISSFCSKIKPETVLLAQIPIIKKQNTTVISPLA